MKTLVTEAQRDEILEAREAKYVTRRAIAPELEDILFTPFPVLDQGFVRVVDYLGSDASIVQAARVSYGVGTKQVSNDAGLINYLMRHRHSTPLEMCEIKLHVRVPMDCWRQWIRHRTANVNEYSTRYSIAIDAMQETAVGAWRGQATVNRQGSQGFLHESVGAPLSIREREFQLAARSVYEERLTAGVAREQARKDLPLSTYTEAYWKIDLHNLLHFLSLRADAHAQLEIREYATVILHEIVRRWVPITYGAFVDHVVNGRQFSQKQLLAIGDMINGALGARTTYDMSAAEWREMYQKLGRPVPNE